MSDTFLAVPAGMEAYAAANEEASALITTVGSADSMAMLNAAAAALGPAGAIFLAPYAPAQANNLMATLLVGGVHAGIGAATAAARAAVLAADSA